MTPCPARSPDPQPRAFVGPAGAAALLRCALQVAFRDDPEASKEVPRTPALCIGTAAHSVLERSGAGHLPTAGARAEAWDEAIHAQIESLAASAAPLPPWAEHPERWPYYSLKRARALRLAARLALAATPACVLADASAGRHGVGPRLPGVAFEVWREAFGGKLKGKLDVVRQGPPKVIEDYKSGSVSDEQTGQIKEDYVVQMLLYAVLEHSADNIWPERATLIPLGGPPVELPISPDEATDLAERVVDAFDTYRAAIPGELEALARPAPSACSSCPFAVCCQPFWAACDESWHTDGVTAMCGILTHTSSSGTFVTLGLESVAGSVRGQVTLRGLSPSQLPSGHLRPGDTVGIASARQQAQAGEFWATPSTRVERA